MHPQYRYWAPFGRRFRHRSASAPFGCRFFVIRHSTFIQSSFRLSFGNLSVVIILLFDRHSSALGRHMRRLVAICAVWSSFCRIWPSSSSFGSSFNHNTIVIQSTFGCLSIVILRRSIAIRRRLRRLVVVRSLSGTFGPMVERFIKNRHAHFLSRRDSDNKLT